MPSDLKLTFFGSAAGFPTKRRPHATSIGLWRGSALYLFDTGDGAASQFARLDVPPEALRAVFITHLHADHIGGLAALVQWLELNKRTRSLAVYLPDSAIEGIADYLHLVYLYPLGQFNLELRPISSGFAYEEGGLTVTAAASHHLEPGEEQRRARGARAESQAFSYTISAEDRSLYISGDLDNPREAAQAASGADVAVVELAHFTPEDLGEALSGSGISHLVVTHLIDTLEPEEESIPDRLRAAGFEGEITVATDGLELEF